MHYLFCVVMLSLILTSCGGDSPEEKKAKQEMYERVLKKASAKDAVRMKLRDPDSAQFRNLITRTLGNNLIVCGEVNSKNGFGAYSGYQHFISNGHNELTFLEEQMKDFHKVWNEFCATKN